MSNRFTFFYTYPRPPLFLTEPRSAFPSLVRSLTPFSRFPTRVLGSGTSFLYNGGTPNEDLLSHGIQIFWEDFLLPLEDKDKVIAVLNKILESELAGCVRHTHYALMVFGYNRIPITSWFRDQAAENLDHAHKAGEVITHLGGHPSLGIGNLLETHKHDIGQILKESLEIEQSTLKLYMELLDLVKDRSVFLEEYAREMVRLEEEHIGEVDKMLRKPGDIHVSEEARSAIP